MRYILSSKSKMIVKDLPTKSTLLAFDFDGTLAPIVDDPSQARMRSSTKRLLRRLACRYACIVVSGRSRTDLRRKLAGTGIHRMIGNHGAEPWEGAAAIKKCVRQWQAALARELAPLRGVRIEDKEFSLTVHYRQCRFKAQAQAGVLRAATRLSRVRLIPGKAAISIVPHNAPNKGEALRAEMQSLRCDRAIYVGDDETDEDVFRLGGGFHLLTIRVGRSPKSEAAYFLRGQSEIDELLRLILGRR
jgi:trehalose 6-phosphate phosphatase